jgi:hypothetical protein
MINPLRKEYSAIVSYKTACFVLLRIERKAHKQLLINNTKHTAVMLSIIVVSENFKSFIEVNTTKQKPSRLDEEFNICGALLSLSLI